MQLRDYQKRILNRLHKSLKANNKVIVQAPTGAGKTVMLAAYVNLIKDKNILIVVDKLEILQQFARKMYDFELQFDMLHGECKSYGHNIVLSTIQTLYRRELEKDFEYIFFDEIHNYYDKLMYNKLIEQYPNAKIIGFSATPIDSKGYLLTGFDDCVSEVQIIDLIRDGYLCDADTYINNHFDLNTKLLKLQQGDYAIDDIERYTVTPHNLQIVYEQHMQLAYDKKCIYFCSSVRQAEAYSQFFKEGGVKNIVITSNSRFDERVRAIRLFREGEEKVIFNVNILTTGFDEPSVEVIGLLNPTRILRKYIQCCGRGLRKADNKNKCLILDFVKNYQTHGDIRDLRYYKQKEEKIKYKDCPQCGMILQSHIKECPQCNFSFTEEIERGEGKPLYTEMQKLEKAYNYQQELIKQLSEVIKERRHKPGYLFYLLKDILSNKPTSQSTINYYRSKLTQIKAVREKGYKLDYVRYNHGKYEDSIGVSNSESVSSVVSTECFYSALMARTKRHDI